MSDKPETYLDAAGALIALIVLIVLCYLLMVMATEPQTISKVTDTSDVTVVENGVTWREWSSEYGSNKPGRRVYQ